MVWAGILISRVADAPCLCDQEEAKERNHKLQSAIPYIGLTLSPKCYSLPSSSPSLVAGPLSTMDRASSHNSEDPEKINHDSQSSRESPSPAPVVDPALDKRVWRKLDLFILPVVTMFYLLSFLVSLVLRSWLGEY